ncbi:ATP-binding protein [Vibrio sp. JC009]|uniref:sensor histidine kinase n=1 Tax=Vibrio sp. JC009 TaxID=2912314 RepID=UPI0023B10A0B|nr:ATP-binding protein [Vibrio sp. JC009]WED22971.1 ATP-binding protein [Vibrio sp. JC009]
MSFRTRIFSISIFTVSAVLAIVVILGWSRINKVELEHLDSRLCMEAKRMVPRQSTDKYELPDNRLINDMVDKLRVSTLSQLMVLVKSEDNDIILKSEGSDAQRLISIFNRTERDAAQPASKSGRRGNLGCQFVSFEHNNNQWRASFFAVPQAESFIAVDLAATTSELRETLQTALIFVIPFSLLLSILGAWFIATNTIRPIDRLQKSMDKVTQKDLSHRLSEYKEDKEFRVLIDAYNTMLDRLEESFQQTSRFTADAAHELKTPLTVLRGKLEQAVINEDPSQVDLNAILDEVGHLSAITRKLLLLSQADSGSMALHLEAINITDLLDELTADMELVSEELVLHCSIERELNLKGDIVLLRQLFNNLLTNAMRYSLQDKGIIIKANRSESGLEVLISNFCQPMSEEVREHLFERFYRGELEHIQGISGSGLGLSLAREIARAHGGELTLEPSQKDVVTMRLYLP